MRKHVQRNMQRSMIAATLLLASPAVAQDYIGPANGSWDNPQNWSPAVVPNSLTAIVKNWTGTTVIIPEGVDRTVYYLNLNINSGVSVGANSSLTVDQHVHGRGTIYLTGENSRLNTNGNDLVLLDDGAVIMSHATSKIDGGGVLVNALNRFISGYGQIGLNNTVISNSFIINANVPGKTLIVDPAIGDNRNSGALNADNGGTLILTGAGGGAFDGTGGAIRSESTGATVLMVEGFSMTNGRFITYQEGLIKVDDGQSAFATDMRNEGKVHVGDGANLHILNTMTNSGTFIFDNNSGTSRIRGSGGSVNVTGTGTFDLTAGGTIDDGRYTFSAGQTIRGKGRLGTNESTFINNGVIDAQLSGQTLEIDAGDFANAFVNNGTLRASNGGTLKLSGIGGGSYSGAGAVVVNAGSTLLAADGAMTELGHATGLGTLESTTSSQATFKSIRVANIVMDEGGILRIQAGGGDAGTSKVNSLTISNGQFDLTDHALIVDYTDTTVADSIRSHIANARNNGDWSGSGITSSMAMSDSQLGVGYLESLEKFGTGGGNFFGQFADETSILVNLTILGDTDLDRDVDFADLLSTAQNYGEDDSTWFEGDFDYDNTVSFDDLLSVAQNYGHSLALSQDQIVQLAAVAGNHFFKDWQSAQALTPEPTILGFLSGTVFLASSRRNSR